jgi:cytochrome c biogenesis protein CcmG/thiol:disulfide interchange protein DsbE
MRRLLALVCVLTVLAGCGEPASDPAEPTPRQAPTLDFTRPAHDGSTFTLSDHRGDVVVLNFWATWCIPCLAEMPEFVRMQDELREQDVQFVGVSQDEGGLDTIRPFAEDLGVNYPLVPDPELDISAQFGGVPVLPTTFILDRDGAIRGSAYGALDRTELLELLDGLIDPSRLAADGAPDS